MNRLARRMPWLGFACGGVILAVVGLFTDAAGPLFLGWAHVLERALPRVEINVAGVATAAVCLAGAALMFHYFSAWFYGHVRSMREDTDWPTTWRGAWTLCLLAALVMMFVAGLVGVGLSRTIVWFLETPFAA